MKKDLLIIERNTRDSLTNLLTVEGYAICTAETAGAGLEAIKRHKITHSIILNALSMRTKGDRTCVALKKAAPSLSVLVYSDQEKPPEADMLIRPGLSIRRLVNSIEMYSPLDRKSCIQYGDIFLDEGKQRVFTPKGVTHLSTKGMQVLKYLIKKKGALVTKEELFTRIWKTSYVEDMNTLYTHMAYLRRAIEEDPSAPRYLLTVRGKGYMLNGK
jgi:two-component system response regulator RegX3